MVKKDLLQGLILAGLAANTGIIGEEKKRNKRLILDYDDQEEPEDLIQYHTNLGENNLIEFYEKPDNELKFLIKKEIKEYHIFNKNLEDILGDKNYYKIQENNPIPYITDFGDHFQEPTHYDDFNQENIIQPLFDIGQLQQEHDYFINLDNKLKNRPVVLTPTQYVEESKEMAERIAAIGKTISAEEMNAVVRMLRIGPLLTAVSAYATVLSDKATQPTRQLRQRIDHLLGIYKGTTDEKTNIGKVLASDIPASRSVKIHNPWKDSIVDLNKMLVAGGACTKKLGPQNKKSLQHSPAHVFDQDSAAGGSVHFQFNGILGQNAYNRLYLAVDKDGNPNLFADCIESGDMSRTTVSSYISNGISDVLLGSFASSIIIANRLGLNKLSFGDVELVDVARHLGFGEKKIFNGEENHTQKLGYVGGKSHLSGSPYLWMMQRDKAFRTVDPGLYQPGVLKQVVGQAYQVMERIESNRKSLKNLRKDYEQFFGMVNRIYDESSGIIKEESFARLKDDLYRFSQKYDLNVGGLEEPEAVLPERPLTLTPAHFSMVA
jgi:hypothetical protein